jgi:hypothetical protein
MAFAHESRTDQPDSEAFHGLLALMERLLSEWNVRSMMHATGDHRQPKVGLRVSAPRGKGA